MISTAYHTDCFYQRMLDLGGKAMGIPINYGTCKGGPWNNKHLAHGEATYLVAIDKFSKKPMIGVLQTSATQETFNFGTYRWAPLSKEWIWFKAPDEAS